MSYLLAYGHFYVAQSGPTPAHGYEYVPVASKALLFSKRSDADFFLLEGPTWARDMADKGLIRVMRLVDGKAQPVSQVPAP